MIKDPDKKRAYNKAYHLAHREEICRKAREYQKANPESVLKKNRDWVKANRDRLKSNNLKRVYGITLNDWNKLFDLQKGRCSICKSKFTTVPRSKRSPVVHHCHGPSKHVHGLICNTCNLAEGYLGTPQVALAMYNYMMQDELLSYQNGNTPKT